MIWEFLPKQLGYVGLFSSRMLADMGIFGLDISKTQELKYNANPLLKGRLGESLVRHFFLQKDFILLDTLFRSHFGEIDQIWQKDGLIYPLEIRTRYLPEQPKFMTRFERWKNVEAYAANYPLFPSLKKSRSLATNAFLRIKIKDEEHEADGFLSAACFIQPAIRNDFWYVFLQIYDWLSEEVIFWR